MVIARAAARSGVCSEIVDSTSINSFAVRVSASRRSG
jgi:hypothetical protein